MTSPKKTPAPPSPKKVVKLSTTRLVVKSPPKRDPSAPKDPKRQALGKLGAEAIRGRPIGAKSTISQAKIKMLAIHGQTPLEFLTAVYRNQLYSDYDVEVVDEAKGLARVYPKLDPITGALDCQHIPVEIERRIAAATAAAPYVHRKRPIGIDGGEGKPLTFVSADQLSKLSDDELGKLLEVMSKLGIGAEFAGGEQRQYDLED